MINLAYMALDCFDYQPDWLIEDLRSLKSNRDVWNYLYCKGYTGIIDMLIHGIARDNLYKRLESEFGPKYHHESLELLIEEEFKNEGEGEDEY